VIEDLDGTTVEPARRARVAVLSGAVAAVALALLVALANPPSVGRVAEAPSAAPSASDAPTMTLASADADFRRGSGRVMLDQLLAQPASPLVCALSRPDIWGPALVVNGVSYAVGERTERALPPPADLAPSPSSWLRLSVYDRSGLQLLYTCGQSETLMPRTDLTTITP
jgi:hypothetical protein